MKELNFYASMQITINLYTKDLMFTEILKNNFYFNLYPKLTPLLVKN